MGVIEVDGLRKEYRRLRRGRTVALDGLDLDVPEGGVFGFLGPNGAGKTTTIRCLLGLVRPSHGQMRMLGSDVPRGLGATIGRVGSIVEQPALFPRFSGRRNLEILARLQGVGASTITAVLERVGLEERQRDLVRTYSLGMKQRLGIAAALMKDPALLILDEPANGLDPAGIVEVRELVRTLGAEGRTVFVSSHILTEVQQTADRVAILARGRCVKAGPVAEVLSGGRRAHHARARRSRPVRLRVAPRRGRSRDGVPRAHARRGAGAVIRLVSAEFLRARSRRVIRLLVVGIIAGVVIGVGIGTWNSDRGSAQAQYEAELASCLRGDFGSADDLPPRYATIEEFCADQVRIEYFASNEIKWVDVDDILEGMASIVILVGALVGASLGGADWTAGTMGTLLTWEPRRARVLLVRAAIAAAAAFGVAVFAQAFFALVFRLGVAVAGTAAGSPTGLIGDATQLALRTAAVAALTAVVAHAIATFGRSTVAAVGVLFGYLVLVEGFLSNLWTDLQPRLLVRAAVVVVSQKPLYDPDVTATIGPNGGVIGQSQAIALTYRGAWVVVVLWAAIALGIALVAFRTRDVT
jgi:ABC-type multidrug transport system ATPase subunit